MDSCTAPVLATQHSLTDEHIAPDAPPVRRYEESAQSNCSPLQGTASVFTACSVSFTHLSHLSAWVERVLCAWVYSQRTPALPSHWPAQLVVQSLLELMLSKQADHSTTSSRMIFFFLNPFDSIRIESDYWHSYNCMLKAGAGRDQVERQNILLLQSNHSKVQVERD